LVALEVAGIGGEILSRPELERIHENAHDHAIGALASAIDQAQMPFVQESHGGDEPDAAPADALGARPGTHLTQAFDQLHRRLLELHHGAVGQVGVAEPGYFPHTPAWYGEQPRGERL